MFNIKDYFKKENVLDDIGFIELINGMVVDPLISIVNSARVSFNKEVTNLEERDFKLIKYLLEHEHKSVFRHSYFTFRIKAPLFVFRQWWKYQIGSEWIENSGNIEIPETNWNEASGRYVEFEPIFYIPKTLREQSVSNKQGSIENSNIDKIHIVENTIVGDILQKTNEYDAVNYLKKSCNDSYNAYVNLINSRVSKEQARMILPQNIYTECIWTCSLETIIYFLKQRLKQDAQFEIRSYALALRSIMGFVLDKI